MENLKEAILKAENDNARLEEIIAAIGDPISIQDTNFKVIYQNRRHRDIVGDCVGEYCYKAYHGKDYICEGCHLALCFKDGMIHKVERSRVTENGIVYSENVASPLRDSTGKITAGIEIVRDITKSKLAEKVLQKDRDELEIRVQERTSDLMKKNETLLSEITERKKAEQYLLESKERFRTMVEQSPLSIQILAPDGRTIEVNRAWEKLWGVTLEDLNDYNILYDKQLEQLGILPYIYRAYSGESVFIPAKEYDVIETLGKGTKRWVQANIYPVKDESGNIHTVVLMHEDISERKRLEREILEIEERERQRIGHDLHDNLGQQLAGISYKIGSLKKTLEEKLIPEAEAAARIKFLIDNAKEHVKNLSRGLSPMVGKRGEGLIEALKELVSRAEEIFNISCVLKYDETIPVHDGTMIVHLYRIAQEAITNAVQHAAPEHIEISLKKEHDKITMMIKDNGTGIPEISERNNGMGLQIMKYRSNMIGALMDIQPDINGGTLVTCIFNDSGESEIKGMKNAEDHTLSKGENNECS